MAKLSKAADFRGLSQEQIHEQVQAAKRELFDLRMKQKTKQVRASWRNTAHPFTGMVRSALV